MESEHSIRHGRIEPYRRPMDQIARSRYRRVRPHHNKGMRTDVTTVRSLCHFKADMGNPRQVVPGEKNALGGYSGGIDRGPSCE